MRVFGIAGHSGMGKTTLLEQLLPLFQARGLAVSVIKHSHKDLELPVQVVHKQPVNLPKVCRGGSLTAVPRQADTWRTSRHKIK